MRVDRQGAFSARLPAPAGAGGHSVRTRGALGRGGVSAPLAVVAGAPPALSAAVGWSDGRRLSISSASATRLRVVGSGFGRPGRSVLIRQRGGRGATLRVHSRGRVSGSLRLRARRVAEPTLVVVTRRTRLRLRLRAPGPVGVPPGATGTPQSVAGASQLLLAAGDIACAPSGGKACQQGATAQVVQSLNPTVVAALGDQQYDAGSLADYRASFDPTWGRFKALVRPVPGNHDYGTSGAAGYFAYFGAAAGAPGSGYYSYDLGAWHVIALNSSDHCKSVPCAAGSAQERWLRADLAAHPTACVLAYMHLPRFSSGIHGDNTAVGDLWRALHEAGAEVVLAGHDHDYERFAPQDPDGRSDPARGLREFVVGTGGYGLRPFERTAANSEARDSSSLGVLALTLRPNGYDWRFVPATGAFTDAGSGACHS